MSATAQATTPTATATTGDPLALLLARAPTPCPRCGHLLTSAPEGRCLECGIPLAARVAVAEPSAGLLPVLFLCGGLSAAIGLLRWVSYVAYGEILGGRLHEIPRIWLALDAALLAAPIACAVLFAVRRRLARLERRRVVALALVMALPFAVDFMVLIERLTP